jgi:hypothetical protein
LHAVIRSLQLHRSVALRAPINTTARHSPPINLVEHTASRIAMRATNFATVYVEHSLTDITSRRLREQQP